MLKIIKFGGGCFQDANSMDLVLNIILQTQEKRVVVVSALKGITDLLAEAIRKILAEKAEVSSYINEIKDVHLSFTSGYPPGTIIFINSKGKREGIKSVACNQEIGLLLLEGPGVGYKPGVIAEIGEILATEKVNIYSILTSQTCLNFILHQQDLSRAYLALAKLKPRIISHLRCDNNLALVGVVGEGLRVEKGIFARVFSAISQVGVSVELVSAGASEVACYFLVKREYLRQVVAAIHREFFP